MIELTQTGVVAVLFAALVVTVNIITQIFKSFLSKSEIPTRVFVLVVSLILTVVTFVAVCQIYSIKMVWYLAVASVVAGFIVAYCAMFGYDNLYGELAKLVKKLLDIKE